MQTGRIITYLLAACFAAAACKPEPAPVKPTPGPEQVPQFETAYEAVANMGVGWNLGNTLDPVWSGETDGRDWRRWETGWGQTVTQPELMTMMRDAGFGAIRVPVTWGVHMDADGKVYDEWMNRVNEVVDYVLDAGLYCIINIHHDTGADEETAWLVASTSGYEAAKEKYENLWRQIAERFKHYDHRLLFESFNEMLDDRRSWCYASYNVGFDQTMADDAYKSINAYAQSFVDVVRSTGGNNAVRNLVVNTYGACNGAGNWNSHLLDPLRGMRRPSDKVKDHIIFQVHSYPGINDLAAMEQEVGKMLDDLQTYLVPLGGPVIVGEWGTHESDASVENYCYYARYFVSEAKRRGIGTFHWMKLSDGMYRSIPCFNDPEITEAIVKGYHGEAFVPTIPVPGDFDYDYKVTYNELWSELNLVSSRLNLDEYQGIDFELDTAPAKGQFHVKIYGESEDKLQYIHPDGTSNSMTFDPAILGTTVERVTLQCLTEGPVEILLKNVSLIRKDGSRENYTPSTYWGCEIELVFS